MRCVPRFVAFVLRHRRGRPAVATAALALAGCASSTSSENFYALHDGGVLLAAAAPASGPGIVVSAVTIPELVDRPQIVTRDSTNRVIVSEQNLWAESIKSGVARTLAARLARAFADAGTPLPVAAYPQTSVAEPALRVSVDILRFDAVPNGEAVVDALWTIRRPADGTTRTGHSVASAPIAGTGYDAIVAGWNAAVASVDAEVAAAVVAVGVDVPPTAAPPAAAAPKPVPDASKATPAAKPGARKPKG